MATVNGEVITQEDVDREVDAAAAKPVSRELKHAEPLPRLIERLLLSQAAMKRGVLDAPELGSALERMLPFPGERVHLPGAPMDEALTPKEKANAAAARAFLADLYVDLRANSLPPITDADVHEFYDKNPLLFSNRHTYVLKEIVVERPTPKTVSLIQSHVRSTGSIEWLAAVLKGANVAFKPARGTRNAEQLPLDMLQFLNDMKVARLYLHPKPNAGTMAVLAIESVTSAPVNEGYAAAAIEFFLINQRKKELRGTEVEELRAQSSVVISEGVRQ